MAQYENPIFYSVESALKHIASDKRDEVKAVAEAFVLRDLKRAMLELEHYEDLAVFRRLEIKHQVDINV